MKSVKNKVLFKVMEDIMRDRDALVSDSVLKTVFMGVSGEAYFPVTGLLDAILDQINEGGAN